MCFSPISKQPWSRLLPSKRGLPTLEAWTTPCLVSTRTSLQSRRWLPTAEGFRQRAEALGRAWSRKRRRRCSVQLSYPFEGNGTLMALFLCMLLLLFFSQLHLEPLLTPSPRCERSLLDTLVLSRVSFFPSAQTTSPLFPTFADSSSNSWSFLLISELMVCSFTPLLLLSPRPIADHVLLRPYRSPTEEFVPFLSILSFRSPLAHEFRFERLLHLSN